MFLFYTLFIICTSKVSIYERTVLIFLISQIGHLQMKKIDFFTSRNIYEKINLIQRHLSHLNLLKIICKCLLKIVLASFYFAAGMENIHYMQNWYMHHRFMPEIFIVIYAEISSIDYISIQQS